MQRAQVLTSVVSLLVPSLASAPLIADATPGTGPLLFLGQDLIRQKQQVPDAPLAGLPSEDGKRLGHGKTSSEGSGRATCTVQVNAANEQDIGHLRAALAFFKHGPKSLPCPARAAQSDIRLRVGIDENGKITAVDLVLGDGGLATSVAKRLTGKSIAPRAGGALGGSSS